MARTGGGRIAARPIPTIYGNQTPSQADLEYMDYLDDLVPDAPISYGLLLFKADPIAFELGKRDREGL